MCKLHGQWEHDPCVAFLHTSSIVWRQPCEWEQNNFPDLVNKWHMTTYTRQRDSSTCRTVTSLISSFHILSTILNVSFMSPPITQCLDSYIQGYLHNASSSDWNRPFLFQVRVDLPAQQFTRLCFSIHHCLSSDPCTWQSQGSLTFFTHSQDSNPTCPGILVKENVQTWWNMQRSKSWQRLDLWQNFQRCTEQPHTSQKSKEPYTPFQQNFTELCRSPVESIPKVSHHHVFCMMISC